MQACPELTSHDLTTHCAELLKTMHRCLMRTSLPHSLLNWLGSIQPQKQQCITDQEHLSLAKDSAPSLAIKRPWRRPQLVRLPLRMLLQAQLLSGLPTCYTSSRCSFRVRALAPFLKRSQWRVVSRQRGVCGDTFAQGLLLKPGLRACVTSLH